jgi:hypothetical protein
MFEFGFKTKTCFQKEKKKGKEINKRKTPSAPPLSRRPSFPGPVAPCAPPPFPPGPTRLFPGRPTLRAPSLLPAAHLARGPLGQRPSLRPASPARPTRFPPPPPTWPARAQGGARPRPGRQACSPAASPARCARSPRPHRPARPTRSPSPRPTRSPPCPCSAQLARLSLFVPARNLAAAPSAHSARSSSKRRQSILETVAPCLLPPGSPPCFMSASAARGVQPAWLACAAPARPLRGHGAAAASSRARLAVRRRRNVRIPRLPCAN